MSDNEEQQSRKRDSRYGEDLNVSQVVSEINTFLLPAKQVCPIAKATNQIARLAFSLPKFSTCSNFKDEKLQKEETKSCSSVSAGGDEKELIADEDGDLILPRKSTNSDLQDTSMLIEYENSTTMDLVGRQIWRGAFLLADYVIHYSSEFFTGKIILELGSGTGMTSVVASMYASQVIATDLNEPSILQLIDANVQHNKELVKCEFLIQPLDFLNLTWSSELEKLVESADVILAADVVYHSCITEAFVETLKKVLLTGTKSKNVWIAMEKRFVFSKYELDTISPMYEDFLEVMENVLGLSLPQQDQISTAKISNEHLSRELSLKSIQITDFPQYFNYEKTKELQLFLIQSK